MGIKAWIKNSKITIVVSSIVIILLIGIAISYKISQYKNPSVNASGNAEHVAKTIDDREEQVNKDAEHILQEQMEVMNVYKPDGKKTVYLTFDDGPSMVTPEVLDILKKNNIHATFFVIGYLAENRSDLILHSHIKIWHLMILSYMIR